GAGASDAERQAIVIDPVTGKLPAASGSAVPRLAGAQERNIPIAVEAEALWLVETRHGPVEAPVVHVGERRYTLLVFRFVQYFAVRVGRLEHDAMRHRFPND